ncbi:hypothetical protein KUCAC02_020794, partial [Chaenocephalus aceratus]
LSIYFGKHNAVTPQLDENLFRVVKLDLSFNSADLRGDTGTPLTGRRTCGAALRLPDSHHSPDVPATTNIFRLPD